MGARGNRVAWASLVAGAASVATVPVAVLLTRYSASYELLDSAYAIPGGAVLGLLALALARRARRESALLLGRASRREDVARAGRVLGTRQGLDFPELEQLTKIRPKYLRALEDEHFDILPAPTYVKGFLRSYAEALGLDGQPFVDEYNSRFAVGDEELVIRTRRVPVHRPDRGGRESRIAVLALLGIAILTALVIAAWRFGGPGEERVPGLAVQGQKSATNRAQAGGRVTVVVRAVRGSSWMEVRSGSMSGRLLYSGTLEQGQSKPFHGSQLQLALSEPQNVSVRLNGNSVGLPAGTAFVVTSRRIARAAS
jgi:hypothetical protein